MRTDYRGRSRDREGCEDVSPGEEVARVRVVTAEMGESIGIRREGDAGGIPGGMVSAMVGLPLTEMWELQAEF